MNVTNTDTLLPNRRLRRILPAVVVSVALAGAASPALAQDPPLSDYNTDSTSSTATPPPTQPPTTTAEEEAPAPAPVPEDNSGVQGEQADENQPAPAAPNAAPAPVAPQAAAPAAAVGSTGRPARLAFTGAEPLIVGLLGAVMVMGAGVAYRRRQLN